MSELLMAVVPSKPFAEAKQRLAGLLDATARAALARSMFEHTLMVLAQAHSVGRVAVISRDDEVLRLARKRGAWSIWETHHELNQALEQATRVARANGVGSVLILPSDLPELTTEEIEQMVALGRSSPCVVIAPAERDEGTNALLVNPVGLIEYAFGDKSFPEHRRRAEAAGARVSIFQSHGTGFDLDLPEDWQRLHSITNSAPCEQE